jgi:hypothetical protein
MFADVVRLGDERLDRRIAEVSERFDHRVREETDKLRLEMSNMKFELVTWMFLFWVGQLAVSISGSFSSSDPCNPSTRTGRAYTAS